MGLECFAGITMITLTLRSPTPPSPCPGRSGGAARRGRVPGPWHGRGDTDRHGAPTCGDRDVPAAPAARTDARGAAAAGAGAGTHPARAAPAAAHPVRARLGPAGRG